MLILALREVPFALPSVLILTVTFSQMEFLCLFASLHSVSVVRCNLLIGLNAALMHAAQWVPTAH